MLDDAMIARYARQIVIPGIGAAGQEKLLASTAVVVGDARGCAQASLYLRAAGVRVAGWPSVPDSVDIVVVADAGSLDDQTRSAVLALGRPVCWYTMDEPGFTSGVHPAAPLPAADAAVVLPMVSLHDAAACDAASLACAVLLGLPLRREPQRLAL